MSALSSLLEAVEDITGGSPKVPRAAYRRAGRLPVVDQGKSLISGYTDSDDHVFRHEGPHIIFGDHTRAVKFVDFPFAMGADGVKVLRARQGFDPKYVYHYLRTVHLPDAGYSRHFKFLKEVTVPRPPLSEQRRIAAILDHADELRRRCRKHLEKLDALTQSAYLDIFGDPLVVGTNHRELATLADVITGNTPSRTDPDNYGEGIEWIKSDNLGGTFATEAEECLSSSGQSVGRVAPAGSVLVTCIAGSPLSIGKASLLDRPAAFNQQINAVIPKSELDGRFLLEQLRVAPDLVRRKSTGGMKGLVSKSGFASIRVYVPSVVEQCRFVDFARNIDRVRGRREVALRQCSELITSLRAHAFSGQL